MGCPTVRFGIPAGGAPEYSVNSGRELFRCGTGCVKMYITNVSGDKSNVTLSCASIADACIGQVCMRSAQISTRDQSVVNWIAKDGVDSSLESGKVITRADTCSGGDAVIYTYTEGNLSVRVTANVENVSANKEEIKNTALGKFDKEFTSNLQWVLSDLGIQASPTDWQGGSVTYQGFGTAGDGSTTRRESFNWENGRIEKTTGVMKYDTTPKTDVVAVINFVLGL